MDNQIHNLDESVVEYFDFIVKGHKYRFQHMTTEEMAEMKKLSGDEEKARDYMFKFISKTDEASPDFIEVSKQMITPQWVKFFAMIKVEFNGQ